MINIIIGEIVHLIVFMAIMKMNQAIKYVNAFMILNAKNAQLKV
jgi:hypothetical protein